jgi:uncharacterized protein YaiL (DUF2058 family)
MKDDNKCSSEEEAAVAPRKYASGIVRHNKKRSRKLTQKEIDGRLAYRAKLMREKFKRLEQSQIVTQQTMHLEFRPLIANVSSTSDKKP